MAPKFYPFLCRTTGGSKNMKKISTRSGQHSLRSRDKKIEFHCTHPRTSWDHNSAFLWGVRRHILKFSRMKVGRTRPNWRFFFWIGIGKKFRPILRLANFNMAFWRLQRNALRWFLFVLARVQPTWILRVLQISDRRLAWWGYSCYV